MSRLLYRLALLLPLVATLLPAPPARAAYLQAVRKPVPGVYLLGDWTNRAAAIGWAQGSAVNVSWQELEPEAERYAFEHLDGWLAALGQAGKKGVIGVLLRCQDDGSGGDSCTPGWALSWDPVIVGSRPRLNYLDARVQAAIERLAAALARHYAADNRLSHVLINLGFDGSASPCSLPAYPGRADEECAAYRRHYARDPDGWQQYVQAVIGAYAGAFAAAGGAGHVPLQVTINGSFARPGERQAIVDAALRAGVGLHDQDMAASFLTGEGQDARCSSPGAGDGSTGPSHWQVLEQNWRAAPISTQIGQAPPKSERALSDEENVWWSVLNALDKHASVMYAGPADLRWADAWQFFARYAGRSERTTTDAWIALRGASGAWCGDTDDYNWFLRRRQADGGSTVLLGASQPGGRTGSTWQGAYSRATDHDGGRPALFFDLDDGFLYGGERVVLAEVSYWDGTPEMAGVTWELSYDAANAPNQSAGTVALRGSGRWLTHPFLLVDATFRNRLPDTAGRPGSDLKLSTASSGGVRFHMLRVKVLSNGVDANSPGAATVPTRRAAASRRLTAEAAPVSPTPSPTPPVGTPAAPEALALSLTARADAPLAGPDVLRYARPGAAGGVADTYLDANLPEQNFVTANGLVLRGDGAERALLRFDLSDLPPAARVSAAWLELTVAGRSRPGSMEIRVYPLRRPWTPGESTWNRAAAGDGWAAPGLAPESDRDAQEVAALALPASGLVQTSVTALVQEWISRPVTNHGILIQGFGPADLEYYLASSEWRSLAARPLLRIRLAADETAAPPPAATPTAPGPSAEPAERVALLRRTPQPSAAATPAGSVRITAVEPALEDGKFDVTAYIYGPHDESPACDWQPAVRLWAAAGQRPAQPLAQGTQRLVTTGGRTFPTWEFRAVDLNAVRGDESILHLFVTVDGLAATHNIVTLGSGQGTFYPQPVPPIRLAAGPSDALDASIEILWPHAGGAITETVRANLSVALFRHGTRDVLPAGDDSLPGIQLHWSINDGPDQAAGHPTQAQARLIQTPWLTYYLWDLPDVDVSAARQPGHYVNFWVEVPGVTSYTNVWSHGFGPRPELQAPPPGTSCR